MKTYQILAEQSRQSMEVQAKIQYTKQEPKVWGMAKEK